MSKKSQWEFYLQRRKCTLEGFLSRAKSLDDAKDLFLAKGLKPPEDELILPILEANKSVRIEEEKQKSLPKKTVPRRKRQPKKAPESSPGTKNVKTPKEDATGGKYFRKVIPAKKKS